ncbi:LOW QUALITY PROTEIN: galactose-specific lectin nattectin-like [Neosynchiropus ocellatus]
MASSLSLIVVLCLTSALWLGAEVYCSTYCPVCPVGWTQYGCHCLKVFTAALPWADAQVACVSEGANLATVNSNEEHTFVRDMIRAATGANTRTFIGGNDIFKEGQWMWADGSSFEFPGWLAGEPNDHGAGEDCLELNFQDAGNDIACSSPKPYVCSKLV